ncbi:MAG: serine hydrolase [Caulobacter sp.]|nr:serine hydrolase [Caulobacter sp.]
MTFHRRDLLAAAVALPTLGLGGGVRAADPAAPDLHLDALLADTGAPALAFAVVTRKGVQRQAAAGVRRLGAPDKVTTNDLWHIGSNTKAMTAALYGRLVEKKRAAWGATVPMLFPDLKLDPAWSRTTVEDLMSHRSGILDAPVMAGGWLMRSHADKRPLTLQRTELAAQVFSAPPAGKPGDFSYSNVGFILVGAAIERIARAGWEETITAELFKPLGMASAGFGAPTGAQPWGHQGDVPGHLTPVDPAGFSDNPAALGPAGRVRLGLADYAKFARLFLTDGGGYLTPDTITHLTTPRPGEGSPYALGWAEADRPWAGGLVLAHEGSNTMWHAVTIIAPARGVAFLTACNAGPEGSKRAAYTLAHQLQLAYAPA